MFKNSGHIYIKRKKGSFIKQFSLLLPFTLLFATYYNTLSVKSEAATTANSTTFDLAPNIDTYICNDVLNSEFNSSTSNWSLNLNPSNTGTWSVDATSQLSGTNSAYVNITAVSGTHWHLRLSQSGLSIENGKTYFIRFKAKASINRPMSVYVQETNSPYASLLQKNLNLTTTATEYSVFTFTAPANNADVSLRFGMGQTLGDVYIDDVVFGEMDCYLSEYTNVSFAINSSSDDAAENTSSGVVDLTNGGLPQGTDMIGLRFTNIAIPQGASIVDAFIEYEVNGPESTALNLTIRAEDVDNATIFTSSVNDISSRTTTSTISYWNSVPAWSVTEERRFSRNISNVIQELIDRPGWISGNAMALIIAGGAGERSAVSFDQAIGGEPILHIGYTTAEVCNNGIDDDGDGLIDCADCDDCSTFSVCSDTDNDESGNFCDLDDDNDGIPDVEEYMCNSAEAYAAAWTHNAAPFDTSYLFQSYWIDTLSNVTLGSGTGAYYQTSLVKIPGIDQANLADAITDQDYLEFGLTTQPGVEAFYISNLRTTVHGTSSTGAVPDNYGYDIAVLISTNNFSSYTTLEGQFTFSSVIGTGITNPYCGIDDNFHYLEPATEYQIRVYFFNKTTNLATEAWFDDFSIYITGCLEVLDTDNDGVYNHLDLDSDNDGIYDVNEAGHAEADNDNDGIIDGGASTFGTNGLFNGVETAAESGLLNYTIANSETTPDNIYDAYELDSDGDSCFDIEEESGYDPDNDGIVESGVPSVNASGLRGSYIYNDPPYNRWQNPAVATCTPEICNNGIDDDGDGLIDCDDSECSLCDPSCGDHDGDGIGDICDLDDDNDGILDDIESLDINTYGDPSFCDLPTFDFSGPVLESGTDNLVNAVYRYSNVSPGLDALVTIVSLTNGSLDIIDNESPGYGFLDAFQPQLRALGSGRAEVEIDFQLVNSGTSTLSPAINRIGGTFYDVDGTANESIESIQIGYPAIVGWDDPNLLEISNTVTGWEITADGSYEGLSIDPDPRLRVYFNYQNINQFTVKFQQYRWVTAPGARAFSMRFRECEITDFENIQLVIANGADQDNDGVDNHLDLDSDNDGIYDLNEAGHTAADVNVDGIIDGLPAAFGSNGFFDGLETYADSDTANYIVLDSEVTPDTLYDAYELDADGDGCFDAREAAVVDSEDDGIAGTGVPAVDANGLVISNSYAAPTDTFWRNPIIAVCNPEICNDGIDNDGDGDIDLPDTECCSPQAPTLTK